MTSFLKKEDCADWTGASRDQLLCRVIQLQSALRIAGNLLSARENHNDLSVQLLEQWEKMLRQEPRPSTVGMTPEAAREALANGATICAQTVKGGPLPTSGGGGNSNFVYIIEDGKPPVKHDLP